MSFDIDEALSLQLQEAECLKNALVTQRGIITLKTAEQWSAEAQQRPDPNALWLSLWYEGEVCCLFADSNLGKSIYAVQIADEIAKHQKVLYFDFELSDKQFQLRYTDEEGNRHKFPVNLYRGEIDREAVSTENFEEAIMNSIEDLGYLDKTGDENLLKSSYWTFRVITSIIWASPDDGSSA